MTTDQRVLQKMIRNALSGKGAYVAANNTFDGLDWKLAGIRREGMPHSVFQLLNHMAYWNQWAVQWLTGKRRALPKHAGGSWPGENAPQDVEEWREALHQFEQSLQALIRASQEKDLLHKQGTKTRLEMLQTIASHNSYHLGQVVLMRQTLGAWPPPSGGLTW